MKKFSIRYSNKGIAILIAFILLISNLFIFTVKDMPMLPEFNKENLEDDIISYLVLRDVDESLTLNGRIVKQFEGIKYLTRYDVIENYAFTKDFKEKYPDIIIIEDNYGSLYAESDSERVKILKDDWGNDVRTNEITEEPIISTNNATNTEDYISNIDDQSNINLETIKNKLDNPYLYINYSFNNDLDIEIGNKEKLKEFDNKIIDKIIDKIKNEKDQTGYSEIKISSLEGIYELTPNVRNIENYSSNLYNNAINFMNLIYAGIIILILFSILVTLTNYEKTKEVSFYNWVRSIPIEVYGIITLIMFVLSQIVIKAAVSSSYEYYSMFSDKIYHLIIGATTLLFMEIIAIYYFIMWFKSLYYEGFNNFMFKNSIIIRTIKYGLNLIKRFVIWIYKSLIGENISSKLMWIGIFFGIFLIFIFGFSIRRGGEIFVIILGVSYYIISKIINDYKKVELGLDEMASGNFEVKIDESNTSFSKMAKDINNIGSSLEEALQKELQSERMKTELITNVSHDLKTPLTSIINYSDLASKEDASNEDIKKYVKIINEKSLKLKTLIENLFEVSKVTSNNIEINKLDIDIVQMLTQTIGEWNDEFESKGIEVIVNSNKDSIIAHLDGEQTSRIFDNLFSNINKYAQENTRVYIDLLDNGFKSTIIIKNVSKYSLNISAEELKERFTRGDESRNTEGSGLGLAIASSLTEIQGGEFVIEIDGDLFKVIIQFYN